MAALLQYEFQILHADRVNAALAANRASFRRHNQQVAADAATAARRSSTTTARAASPGGAASPERALQRQQDRLSAYWNRAAQRSADYRLRQEERTTRMQERHAAGLSKRQVQEQERASKAQERLSSSATKRQVQEQTKADREVRRQQEQSQRYWDRVRKSSLDQRLRDEVQHGRVAETRAQMVRRGAVATSGRLYDKAAGVGSRAMGAVAGVGRAALGLATIGGGFAAAGALGGIMERYRIASGLAAQAGTPEVTSQLVREAGQVKGISATQDLTALEKWVTLTGQLQLGRQQLQEWGKLALATNSQVEDLASGAGEAFVGLGEVITDDSQKLRVVQQIMRSAAGMGAVGSVEIKDLASRMGQVWSAAVQFGGDPEKRMSQMMGIAQIIRPTAGSVDEAVTSIQRLPDDMMQRQERIKNVFGVDVWEKGKKGLVMREAPDILADIIQATGGRKDLLKDKMFDIRAFRAVRPLAQMWYSAEQREKGSGRAEIMKRIGFFESQKRTTKDIDRIAAARYAADPSLQMVELWKNVQTDMGSILLPQFMKLAPEVAKLAPLLGETASGFMRFISGVIPELQQLAPPVKSLASGVADFSKALASRPMMAIGAVITAVIVKDIAAAGLGMAVKAIITQLLLSSAGGSAAGMAAKTAAGSIAGSVGAGALGAAAGATVGRGGILGGVRAGLAGAAAATGLVAAGAVTAAAGGLASAVWQATELAKDVGMESEDLIPGYRKDKGFSFKTAINDMLVGGPAGFIGGRLLGGVFGEEKRRDAQARDEAKRRGPLPTLVPETGGGFATSRVNETDQGPQEVAINSKGQPLQNVGEVLMSGAKEAEARLLNGAKAIEEAANKLNRPGQPPGGSGINRGNTPSAPTT